MKLNVFLVFSVAFSVIQSISPDFLQFFHFPIQQENFQKTELIRSQRCNYFLDICPDSPERLHFCTHDLIPRNFCT